jgi:dsRNA-specific ribonuclease/signal transduction histidine kinase
MTHVLPALVDLPSEVPETKIWPELSAVVRDDADGTSPRHRRWLTIATLHRSGLYENKQLSAILSPACLSLLEHVGNATLDLELRRAIWLQNPDWEMAQLNHAAAKLIAPARRAVTERLQIADNARLGTGEWQQVATGHSSRSLETVTLQLIGWWSLVLPGRLVGRTVQQIYAERTTDSVDYVDWRTLFANHFDRLSPQFSTRQEGPDHSATFVTTVTTRDGRTATGSAPRKNEAKRLACRTYVITYAPRLIPRPAQRSSSVTWDDPTVHVEDRQLAALYSVSDARLFARALTHQSWAYENATGRDRRASNEVLANLGSSVLKTSIARTKASHLLSATLKPDPDVSTGLTLPDDELVPLGHALGLAKAARLGAGQRQHGISGEMMANFIQATLAAAWLQVPDFNVFEERMPKVVSEFLVKQAGTSMRDGKTRLQELGAELDFEWEWTDERTGPDHCRTYHNTTRITDGSTTIHVEGSGPTRRAAGKAAASVAMEAAGLRSGATATGGRPDAARFFLSRQLDVLDGRRNRWPRWQQQNVLGAGLVANRDWIHFAQWTNAVKRTGFYDTAVSAATRRALEEYYERAARSAGARPIFAAELARALQWVQAAMSDDRQILTPAPYEQLQALSIAHSIWLMPDGTVELTEVLANWARLNRRRAGVVIDVRGQVVVGSQGGEAVQRILQEFVVLSPSPTVELRVSLVPSNSVHEIHLPTDNGWPTQPRNPQVVALISEAAPGVVAEQHDTGAIVKIAQREVTGSGWLWDAATRTRSTDEYDAELGRLLHDLKNEVTAARVALTRKTTTRTERREADLAASRHLDRASAVATQLVDAEMLYTVARPGVCALAPFLRSYSSEVINRVPSGIRVLPPAVTPALIALGGDVLRSVLDNLVKNSVEAMGDEGEIEFSYTLVEEDGVALLEVRDSGPGLPPSLIAALRADAPVPTNKQQGSGLGLPGAMRVLRRAGGDLQPLGIANGASWLLVLPLVGNEDAADG